MNTFIGLGKNHVENYFRKTGNAVFLHLRRLKKEVIIYSAGTRVSNEILFTLLY